MTYEHFPPGVWRCQFYDYKHLGKWKRWDQHGYSCEECDAQTIDRLQHLHGGVPLVIIRAADQVVIWQGIEWPKVA